MAVTTEIWRSIEGFSEQYEVSSLGRVRSLPRTRKGRSDKPVRVSGRFLSSRGLMGSGYPAVCLGKRNSVYVHRLVAAAFIPNPLVLREVNHKDGDKLNAAAENLEWVNHRENGEHDSRLGLVATGARHGRSTKPEAFRGR